MGVQVKLGKIAACAALALSTMGFTPAHAAERAVVVAGFQFLPAGNVVFDPLDLGIPSGDPLWTDALLPTFTKGDVVTWTSLDAVPHRISMISGPTAFPASCCALMSGPGTSSTLDTSSLEPGRYVYGCTIHAGMIGEFQLSS